jgi:hypothetical protein
LPTNSIPKHARRAARDPARVPRRNSI